MFSLENANLCGSGGHMPTPFLTLTEEFISRFPKNKIKAKKKKFLHVFIDNKSLKIMSISDTHGVYFLVNSNMKNLLKV